MVAPVGAFGLADPGQPEHHAVAVDFCAVQGGHGAVGEYAAIPADDLRAVAAESSPLDVPVQERADQFEVQVTIRGLEVSGDIAMTAVPTAPGTCHQYARNGR